MSRRIVLLLVLFAATLVFAAKWQASVPFMSPAWAESDSFSSETAASLSVPINKGSVNTETDTPDEHSAAAASAVLKEATHISTKADAVKTITRPTFTIPSPAAVQSLDARKNTSSENTSTPVKPVTATTGTVTRSTGTETSSSSENTNVSAKPVTATIGIAAQSTSTKTDTSAYTAPTSGTLRVTTTATDAKSVEYYSQSKQNNTETYLGTAQNTSSGTWSMDINAANQLPNGEYNISARAQHGDGTIVQSQSAQLSVTMPEYQISSEEKVKFENSDVDTDGEGISDKEEIRLGTNPKSADTDGDGFLDGDEIKNGFDPLKFSTGNKSDKIVFESPKEVIAEVTKESTVNKPEVKKVNDKRFTVDKVELVGTGNAGEKATRFSGKALPNMFVTLYIYSDPIVVTVKTDADGNWTYDLDKELPNGDHEIYVAVTDNVGKISAQSGALPFVKTAEAAAIKPTAAASVEALQNTPPLERSKTEFIVIAIIIAMSFLGIALVVIGRKSSIIQ